MFSRKKIKEQRNRFLAFSFASADLLLETCAKGKILYAIGAAQGITGIDEKQLLGKNWLQLFETREHSDLIKMQDNAVPAQRCGPLTAAMDKSITDKKATVTAIKMPNTSNFYVAISVNGGERNEVLSDFNPDSDAIAVTTDFDPDEENQDAVKTDFKAENEGDASLTTDYNPDDEQQDAITTGFEADDDAGKALETGFEGQDDEQAALTTDHKPDDEEQTALTTDHDPTKDEEESLTTDHDLSDEEQNALTTDHTLDQDEQAALTTDMDAGEKDEDTAITQTQSKSDENGDAPITTDFDGNEEEEEDPVMTYDKTDFVNEAENTFQLAKEQGIETAMTVFDFGRTETIPEEQWDEIIGEIGKYLRKQALNDSAAEIAKDKFSIIHDAEITSDTLREYLNSLKEEIAPESGELQVAAKTIETDLDKMDESEAARALHHTINEFAKEGTDIKVESLKEGYEELVTNNEEKIKDFKGMLDRVDFDISFMPIVDIKTRNLDHYEVLSRFKDGETQEWISFGEDIGMAAEFDVAVLERVMNFIHYKAGTTRTKFSINISEYSITDKEFYKDFLEQLSKRDVAHRLIFEITDSAKIKQPVKVAQFITTLSKRGYEFTLDDCDDSEKSLKNIRTLGANHAKIDGRFVRKILESPQDEQIVRNVVKACQDAGVEPIAEFIESAEEAALLTEIGVTLGQGFAYSEPRNKPDYIPPVT